MSVESPRHAAAQRTAASRRVRAFRLATWLLIVPTLSAFSFSVVAGAGLKAKPDYAAAVGNVEAGKRGVYLVVRDESDNPLDRFFGGSAQKVCWINRSQLARVSQKWQTGSMTISYKERSLNLVTVNGAKTQDLRAELGDVSCTLVQISRTFYLPFDAHGS
jgi:hypothetical protein